MKFFLDENFPKTAGEFLVSRGHEVLDVRGTAEEGLSDREIFTRAQEQQALFLTTDRDFFHTIPHLFSSHHGVVVIALRQPNRQAILDRLEWVLDRLRPESSMGTIYLLRDRTVTVLPPEDSHSE